MKCWNELLKDLALLMMKRNAGVQKMRMFIWICLGRKKVLSNE